MLDMGNIVLISIHALREEGDSLSLQFLASLMYFYPRPPRGGRLWAADCEKVVIEFLSTPSARRATFREQRREVLRPISIHALREEGDGKSIRCTAESCKFLSTPSARRATFFLSFLCNVPSISIHALREEGDERALRKASEVDDFYPRPPRGGRPPPLNSL